MNYFFPTNILYEIYQYDSTFHEIYKNVMKDIHYFQKGNIKNNIFYINTKNKKAEWLRLSFDPKTFEDYYKDYEHLPLLIHNKYKVSYLRAHQIRNKIYEKIKNLSQSNFMNTIFLLQYEINKNKNLYQLISNTRW